MSLHMLAAALCLAKIGATLIYTESKISKDFNSNISSHGMDRSKKNVQREIFYGKSPPVVIVMENEKTRPPSEVVVFYQYCDRCL